MKLQRGDRLISNIYIIHLLMKPQRGDRLISNIYIFYTFTYEASKRR